MKVHNTYSKPVVSGAETSAFSMQSSGKMFKMVISGLYSDKPQSITREIYSNAFDAHAMSGKDLVPFEVSLPSRWTPQFSVRDFGEGLSHEWMKAKYTIVGHSSKEDSNLAVGKWGVGRMSPLSYIDTFAVESIHKGMKAIYNVTMAEDGSPELNTLVPPMKTDEPSGLKVSFPVKPEDMSAFQSAARRVSLGLPVKPTVEGNPGYQWPEFERGTSGDGYVNYTHKDGYGSLRGVVVQMGCVIYPVDLKLLDLTPTERSVFDEMNIFLETPIGSVEVTASREDLSYGPKEPTKGYLTGVLKRLYKDMVKDTQEAIDKAPNDYQAVKMKAESGLHYRLKGGLTYNGKPLDKWESKYSTLTLSRNWSGKISRGLAHVGTQQFKGIIVGYKNGPKGDKRIDTRIRSWLATTGSRDTYLCVQYLWDPQEKEYSNSSVVEEIVEYFGETVYNVSDMPDVAPVSRGRTQAKVYDFNWDEQTVNMDDGGVYVKSLNSSVQGLTWYSAFRHLNCAKGQTQVIANKTLWKKFDDHEDWEDITDKIIAEVKSREDEWYKVMQAARVNDHLGLRTEVSNFGHEVKEYYRLYDSVKAKLQGVNTSEVNSLLRASGIYSVSECDEEILMEKLREKFLVDYPLMRHYNSSRKQEYIDYVKALREYRKV